MKKLLIVLGLCMFLLTGCGNSMTPTGAVENFLGKYQSLDSDVLAQLDSVVSNDSSMSDEQKAEYKSLMEKQYQYLSYKIKNEEIVDDTATVDVEIEVFDYATSINKSGEYYNEHPDEFLDDDDDNDNDDNDNDNDNNGLLAETKAYIDYKIEQLKNVTDKVKYTITFNLTKEDDEWVVDDISDIDRQKIHGLFSD